MSLEQSIAGLERAGFLPAPATDTPSRPQTATGYDPAPSPSNTTGPRQRPDARTTTYFNHLGTRATPSTDAPPSYAQAARTPFKPETHDPDEELPRYTCPIYKTGPMQMLLESCSPFATLPYPEWRDVFVEARGTQLNIYKLKTHTVDKKSEPTGGKLLVQYTMQQAECGYASDVQHSLLVPASKLASLIPNVARKRAYARDQSLFIKQKQYSFRVRAEMDQFVLACPNEQLCYSWMNHVMASIDVAPAIDERSLPRQTTIPRRRRRQQHQPPQPNLTETTDLTDHAFLEQQARIMQSLYPNLGDESAQRPESSATEASPRMEVTEAIAEESASHPRPLVRLTGPGEQEGDDIDLSGIAEDAQAPTLQRSASVASAVERPSSSRQTNMTQISAVAVEPPTYVQDSNIDPETGKWAPAHPKSGSQQMRYIRRCLPVLLADTPRHSGVMVYHGKFVRPNYRLMVLEVWRLQPPTYDAHDFASSTTVGPDASSTTVSAEELERSASIASTSVQSLNGLSAIGDVVRVDSPLLDRELDGRQKKTQQGHGDGRADSTISPLDKVVTSPGGPEHVVAMVF